MFFECKTDTNIKTRIALQFRTGKEELERKFK
jgi:hypothetical protein